MALSTTSLFQKVIYNIDRSIYFQKQFLIQFLLFEDVSSTKRTEMEHKPKIIQYTKKQRQGPLEFDLM